MCSRGCGVIGKFCKRYACSPTVWPIMAVDVEVLLKCLDCSFTESICLWMVGSREVWVDIELSVNLCEELKGKLQATIHSYISR